MYKQPTEADIVLVDIINFSRLSMPQQLKLITYISQTCKKMLQGIIPAGDGLDERTHYIEIKNLMISTILVSNAAFSSLQSFLTLRPDFAQLLYTQGFRHSSVHTFEDKHKIKREGYLIWMRQGGIIPPPKSDWLLTAKRSPCAL